MLLVNIPVLHLLFRYLLNYSESLRDSIEVLDRLSTKLARYDENSIEEKSVNSTNN
jgi:hypothetical protein